MKKKKFGGLIVILALFLFSVFFFEDVKGAIYEWTGKSYLIEGDGYRYNLPLLTWQHLEMSFWACLFSILIGAGLGLIALTKVGSEFRPVIEKFVSLTKALPAVGILAIFIPIFGFGIVPGAIVLVIGGTMPIVFSTISGIENVPEDMLEVGMGMGMTRWELFWKVKVPIALPVLISGMRSASVIIIGSATLAAITGAGGLGIPIFNSGIRGFDPVMLMEGAIPVSLLALLVDKIFSLLEEYARYRFGVVS